jgi:hypothetical protein
MRATPAAHDSRCVTTHAPHRAVAALASACLAAALAIGPARAHAQESSEGSFELALWKKLSDTTLLYFPIAVTRADATEHAEGLVGASLDRVLKRRIAVRAGYRYVWELTPEEGTQPYREQRAVFELTVRAWSGANLVALDRTRFEWRWSDSTNYWILRNRVRAGRKFALKGDRSLTPYAMVEATYDSQYDTIRRVRGSLGLATRFTRRVMVDGYLALQRDTRAELAQLQASGVTLNLFF